MKINLWFDWTKLLSDLLKTDLPAGLNIKETRLNASASLGYTGENAARTQGQAVAFLPLLKM